MMDEKTAELVAIGAAYSTNCDACLTYHIRRAAEVGASVEEALDAIHVAKMIRSAATQRDDHLVSHLFGEDTEPEEP